ncbi:hypothetical protein [Streptomyces sp. NPDC001070]
MWFADALASCTAAGAEPTRACVERFVGHGAPCDARGLLIPVRFRALAEPPVARRACLSVARWSDTADGGGDAWIANGDDMERNCFDVPQPPYRA